MELEVLDTAENVVARHRATAIDASFSGMKILAPATVSVEPPGHLRVLVRSGERVLSFTCSLQWSRRHGRSLILGLRFVQGDERDTRKLIELVHRGAVRHTAWRWALAGAAMVALISIALQIPWPGAEAPGEEGNDPGRVSSIAPPVRVAPSDTVHIDVIKAEKERVCVGEGVVVSAVARTEKKQDHLLRISINGQRGAHVVLTPAVAGKLQLEATATLFPGISATKLGPTIEVVACVDEPRVTLTISPVPDLPQEFVFRATVSGLAARALAGARYHFDFGDALPSEKIELPPREGVRPVELPSQRESDEPVVDHSYARRAQLAVDSSYLASVRVVLRDGRTLGPAVASVVLENASWPIDRALMSLVEDDQAELEGVWTRAERERFQHLASSLTAEQSMKLQNRIFKLIKEKKLKDLTAEEPEAEPAP